MFRLSIVISLLFIVSNVFAQEAEVKDNKWFVGGSARYFNTNSGGDFSATSTSFGLSTGFGYQVKDNLAIGLSFSVFSNRSEASSFESDNLGIGLFTRHVFNTGKAVQFYLQPQVSYSDGATSFFDSNNSIFSVDKHFTWQIGVGAGITYDINDKWRLTANVASLNYEISKNEFGTKRKSFEFNSLLSNLNLGVEFKF